MSEFTLVEKPIVQHLADQGFSYLPPSEPKADISSSLPTEYVLTDNNTIARDGLNQVLLRDDVIASLQRINGITEDDAKAAYQELLTKTDNEEWRIENMKYETGNMNNTVIRSPWCECEFVVQ